MLCVDHYPDYGQNPIRVQIDYNRLCTMVPEIEDQIEKVIDVTFSSLGTVTKWSTCVTNWTEMHSTWRNYHCLELEQHSADYLPSTVFTKLQWVFSSVNYWRYNSLQACSQVGAVVISCIFSIRVQCMLIVLFPTPTSTQMG